MKMQFNLVDESWIRVKYLNDKLPKMISLATLFKDSNQIKKLAGDSRPQDLAVLRLLEAIFVRVYQDGDPIQTWQKLFKLQNFSQVLTYLKEHTNEFDFLSKTKPLMQVPEDVYHDFYAKAVKKPKTPVSIKQLNRDVNESNNSMMTTSFTSNSDKNKIDLPSLVRWIITYQQFSAVTDKGKLTKDPIDGGQLLNIKPFYVKGRNLAETILLNAFLEGKLGKPIWEQDQSSYAKKRIKMTAPDSVCELYTLPSRLLWIDWVHNRPQVHAIAYPKINRENMFEPMTTWHYLEKENSYLPERLSVKSKDTDFIVWYNFAQYFDDTLKSNPAQIKWLKKLAEHHSFPEDFDLDLQLCAYANNGGATSQTPVLEATDDLKLNLYFVFKYQQELTNLISKLQRVGNKCVYAFGKRLDDLYSTNDYHNKRLLYDYYQTLAREFTSWLTGVSHQDLDKTELNKEFVKEEKHIYQLIMKITRKYLKRLQFKVDSQNLTAIDYWQMMLSKIRKEFDLSNNSSAECTTKE